MAKVEALLVDPLDVHQERKRRDYQRHRKDERQDGCAGRHLAFANAMASSAVRAFASTAGGDHLLVECPSGMSRAVHWSSLPLRLSVKPSGTSIMPAVSTGEPVMRKELQP
jgi:hypothetical protein